MMNDKTLSKKIIVFCCLICLIYFIYKKIILGALSFKLIKIVIDFKAQRVLVQILIDNPLYTSMS